MTATQTHELALDQVRTAVALLASARILLADARLPPFTQSSLERINRDAATLADHLAELERARAD